MLAGTQVCGYAEVAGSGARFYWGESIARARIGNLEVELEGVPSKEGGEVAIVATVRVGGRVVLTERFEGGFLPWAGGHACIVQLDPSSALPQVVLSHFTGGAHCCMETRIVTLSGEGQWRVID